MGCFTDPHFLRGTENPKKPEATGSAGRCEPGVGGSPTHTLCPACFSHPLCRPDPGLFPEERNPRVSQGAIRWFGSAHGAHTGLFGAGSGTFPTLGGNPPQRAIHPRETRCFSVRRRRVLRTRGFLTDQATGLVLHTGAQQAGLVFFPVVSTSELVCFVYSWAESVSSRNSRTVGGT